MENAQQPGERRDIKQAYRTAYLIAGFLKQTLTQEESEELDAWIVASEDNMVLFEKMTDEKNLSQAAEWFRNVDVESALEETKRKIRERHVHRMWMYAIAAALVIVVGGSLFFFKTNHVKNNVEVASNNQQDLLPGAASAVLTLADGKEIALGNEGEDTTINKKIQLSRKNGELIYSEDTTMQVAEYNLLTVPRKGQYKLVLPDGTKVWLNAASSIRYPTTFNIKERKVLLTGEAYFEVAKDERKPFRVQAGEILLEDLGTAFDVNSYDNEPVFSTTLLEGAVKVTKGRQETVLKPGEQLQINNNRFTTVNTNAENVVAWKENQFKFSGTPVEEIMRQVERWYDADVVFKDSVSLHMNATISRDVPASKLLHILEATGAIHFKVDGRKIYVSR